MADLGWRAGTSAMELLQLDNRATIKSLHGFLKRYPYSHWACIYGDRGMMEADRWADESRIYLYRDDKTDVDGPVCYRPKLATVGAAKLPAFHHSGDYYMMDQFVQCISGTTDGSAVVDVYQALDMGVPGILAHRSACRGNIPLEVPDFRKKEARDAYRNDNWCTNPRVAGENIAPLCSFGSPDVPDSVYEKVRQMWLDKQSRS